MASVYVASDPHSEVDYGVLTGRVRYFVFKGQKLFDERDGTCVDGWKAKLAELIIEQGWNYPENGMYRAFVPDELLTNANQ